MNPFNGKTVVVLIDTNVAYTYLSGRDDPYSQAARDVMSLCAHGEVQGFLAFHSLSTIWYLTRKMPIAIRRGWLMRMCKVLTVTGASHAQIIDAIQREEFSDFEDCLQDKCAKESGCDFIVTANVKDFSHSEIPAITPNQLMELVSAKIGDDGCDA